MISIQPEIAVTGDRGLVIQYKNDKSLLAFNIKEENTKVVFYNKIKNTFTEDAIKSNNSAIEFWIYKKIINDNN